MNSLMQGSETYGAPVQRWHQRTGFFAPSRDNTQVQPYVELTDSALGLLRIAVLFYFVVFFGLVLLSGDSKFINLVRVACHSVSVLVATLPLWTRMKGVGLLHPLFIFSALIFLQSTLPKVGTAASGLDYHAALPNYGQARLAGLQIQVSLLYMLSWGCIYLGYFAFKGVQWQFVSFRSKKQLLWIASIAGLILGTVALHLLTQASGGLGAHLKNINLGIKAKVWVQDERLIGIYANLIRLTTLAPAAWILTGKKPFSNPAFWLLASYATLASFLVSGRRSAIVLVVVILVACWILRRGSLAFGRLAVVGVLLFLMIGMVGEFRKSNWRRGRRVTFEAILNQDISTTLQQSAAELERRSTASAIYPIVARVPQKVPYRYGSIYFSYLYRFIPRTFWRDKPVGGIGHDCAQIFYGRGLGVGIPPGSLAEAYWSGGVIAIVIVFTFWGVCLKSFGNFFVQFRSEPFANILYLATITKLNPSETGFRSWLYLFVPMVTLLVLFGAMKFSGKNR